MPEDMNLQQSLFQSELSKECEPELPPTNESILSFPSGHPIASYVFFLIFLSLLSPLVSFLQ
jgi:membrane-associated phospholipid phosphatase